MAIINFDVNSVEAAEGFPDAVPAGWYNVIITKTDLQLTANKDGSKLHIFAKILDGEHAGKTIYTNLNWENKNPQAMGIGRSQVAAIAKALGFNSVLQDTQMLHDKPFSLKVKYSPPTDEYSAQNNISTARPIDATQTQLGYQIPATAQQPNNQGMPQQTGNFVPNHVAQTQTGNFVPNQVAQTQTNVGQVAGNPQTTNFVPNQLNPQQVGAPSGFVPPQNNPASVQQPMQQQVPVNTGFNPNQPPMTQPNQVAPGNPPSGNPTQPVQNFTQEELGTQPGGPPNW